MSVTFRKVFMNPANLMKQAGWTRKIKRIHWAGENEITIEMEDGLALSPVETQKLNSLLNSGVYNSLWEVVKDG